MQLDQKVNSSNKTEKARDRKLPLIECSATMKLAVYRGLYMFRNHYGAVFSTFEEAVAYTRRLDEEQIKSMAVQQRPPGCGKQTR